MDDLERVLGWFESEALLHPSAEAPNTVDLSRALASLAGVGGLEMSPAALRLAELIGEADHYVFVLVDGLGMNLIEEQPTGAFLRNHLALELRAVFPATTAAALTSLATGLWPAEHAVPAWWTYLPEARLTATVLPFVERYERRPLGELGVEGASVYLQPPLLPRYRRAVRSFMPRAIADSVYTRYVSGGAPVTAYTTVAGAVDKLIEHIDGAREPTYSYLYIPNVDTAQHVYGPHADEARMTLAEADQQLARLAEGLRGRGRLVASADHGLIEVPDRGKHLLSPDDALLELLVVPPTGEPRVPFFHTRPGRADELARRFRDRFGESYALLSIDEVEHLGLLGPAPLADATRCRVGDFIALTARPEILLYGPPVYHREAAAQRGYHGGLAPAEMRIPLVVA